jgi:hypothetical protein
MVWFSRIGGLGIKITVLQDSLFKTALSAFKMGWLDSCET